VTTVEALVLGVVQGITEFLPISSTAHLRIVPALAGWRDPGAAFTAVLQLGTLAAVVAFFARDLLGMARASLAALTDPARRRDPEARLAVYVVVGTVPVVIAGVLLKDAIHGSLRALPIIAGALIVVALGLALVERLAGHRRDFDEITLRDAMIVGAAQALALVPGVSRSGITLLAAMALGLRRDAAARFSFLLSIPAIAGAGVFELKHVLRAPNIGAALAIGLVASAVTGYASIAWLLRFLRSRSTMPFVVYRLILGVALLVLLAVGWTETSSP
jgi:undecaprenyl-diphosphatase